VGDRDRLRILDLLEAPVDGLGGGEGGASSRPIAMRAARLFTSFCREARKVAKKGYLQEAGFASLGHVAAPSLDWSQSARRGPG
jgi:hypothetical protein